MNNDFRDKNYWALILGGSSGLGLATAKKLAQHGLNICIVHRDARAQMDGIELEFEHIRKLEVGFVAFNMDALNAQKRDNVLSELKKAMGEHGRIRTLVHSLAKGNLKPMISSDKPVLSSEDFNLTINAMALSLYDWFITVYNMNLFAEDARVVSFTSEGNSKAWKYYAAVSAAKVALEAITRNIALEFAPYGIRANCLQAGVTDTASLRMIPGSEELKAHAVKRNPCKRLTTPDDVANAVYLLCKDEASWINGCVIPVDGGEHLS